MAGVSDAFSFELETSAPHDLESEDARVPIRPAHFEIWRFRSTLAYWVGILFQEGAIIIMCGAIFSLLSNQLLAECNETTRKEYEHALVANPYIFGGAVFTLACYASTIETLNLPHHSAGLDDRMIWFWPTPAKCRQLVKS